MATFGNQTRLQSAMAEAAATKEDSRTDSRDDTGSEELKIRKQLAPLRGSMAKFN